MKEATVMFEDLNTKKDKILKQLQASILVKDKKSVELEKILLQNKILMSIEAIPAVLPCYCCSSTHGTFDNPRQSEF